MAICPRPVGFSRGIESEQRDFDLLLLAPIRLAGDMCGLLAGDAADPLVESLDRTLVELGRQHFRAMLGWRELCAHVLADLGSPYVMRFARLRLDMPSGTPRRPDDDLLRLRAALNDGEAVRAETVLVALEEIAGTGRLRHAGAFALRFAHDFERLGAPADADQLRRWGLELLPTTERLTLWEQLWLLPARHPQDHIDPATPPPGATRAETRAADAGSVSSGGPSSVDAGTQLVVRVLRAAVEADVACSRVDLSENAARLLLLLAVSHPVPVHAEQLSDLLWPGRDFSDTRQRLSALFYRLRRTLGPAEAVLQRTGDLVSLDPALLDLDLARLDAALAGPPEDRPAALVGVQGNLGHVQFPYDEPFALARRRLTVRWLDYARKHLADGSADPEPAGGRGRAPRHRSRGPHPSLKNRAEPPRSPSLRRDCGYSVRRSASPGRRPGRVTSTMG